MTNKLTTILTRIISGVAYSEEIAYAYVVLEKRLSKDCAQCGQLYTSQGLCVKTCRKETAVNFTLVFNKTNQPCKYCGKPFFKCECQYEYSEPDDCSVCGEPTDDDEE